MSTLNSILETGKRALLTNQEALGIIGHNVANVNTEGYTRQRPMLEATYPMDNIHFGQIGTGVTIDSIARYRDILLDNQYRRENASLGEWESRNNILSEIENVFTEPSDYGMSNILSDFWNAWADLANDPESSAARASIREKAGILTSTLNNYDDEMRLLEEQVNREYKDLVNKINELAKSIADLNQQISAAENIGQNANDLRDQRDLRLDELSNLADIRFFDQENGSVTVFIGSDLLVQDNNYREMATRSSARNEVAIDIAIWKDTTQDVNLSSGALKGLEYARDVSIEGVRERLDEFAAALIQEINTRHMAGYGLEGSTGIAFFDPDSSGANDIALNREVLSNLNVIAAGKSDAAGDNENALELANLGNVKLLGNGTETFGDYYSSTVAQIGSQKNSADFFQEEYDAVAYQIENLRQSVHGVVMDEELTEMIKFQRAYGASAMIVQVVNDMMNTIVNLVR